MEEEREKRLDPDNRPDGAEIDNTERTFDVDRGQFTDSEDYDDSEPPPFADPEDPNQNDDDSDDDSDDRTTTPTKKTRTRSPAEGPAHRLRRLDRHGAATAPGGARS